MRRFRSWPKVAILVGLLFFFGHGAANAAKPQAVDVARQIDESLAKEVLVEGVSIAPRCDDATFLRRTWLDVVGDIPAPEHVIAFTLDKSPDKREHLVRDLLAD
ncbi:MAG: DUF1549 domain-containing protein, partial [Pirellulales bacterium]|nr:DUF1549 domain-containing protein [Pirellulales bacterium]